MYALPDSIIKVNQVSRRRTRNSEVQVPSCGIVIESQLTGWIEAFACRDIT